MKLPDNIREILKRRFQNKHREWLKTCASNNGHGSLWSLEINLDIPSEQNALRQPDAVRAWISAWRAWQGSGSVVWSERRWRSLGTQSVPEKLILESFDDIAAWTGETARWSYAADRFKSLVQRWPSLVDTLPKYFSILADYNNSDFFSLSEVLTWLCDNPNSNLYIRQVPVASIDSKWLESRKTLVCELFAAIQGNKSEKRDFYRCCGFKPQPQLIRIRILDPVLGNQFNGLSDISAPLEEIAALDIFPAIVFIVENIQTALAFNNIKNAVVLLGLGYRVNVLGKIPWLNNTRCIYWGDIDTHGFAILNRARTYLPNLETVLMDEATLMSHRELWVEEKDQYVSTELPLLTGSELMLFQSLKNNIWGYHVRLEQERIRWNEAWNALKHIIFPPFSPIPSMPSRV